MAARGDVLLVNRKIGFGAGESMNRFAVLESDRFAAQRDSVIVAPLDAALALYDRDPSVVRISSREAGTRGMQVVLVPMLRALSLDEFTPAPVGRLDPRSLHAVARVLRMLFDLP